MTEREIRALRDKIGTDPILSDEEIEYIWMAMDKQEVESPIRVSGEVVEFVVDRLIRHKYPDEKPKWEDWYLVECVSGSKWHEVVYWKDGCFFVDQRCLRKAFNEAITRWWELPGVSE